MANLTISVDPEVLKRARVKALREGITVNALLAKELEEYVAADDALKRQREALRRLGDLADRAGAGSGPGGRNWTREDLYEERMSKFDR